MLSRESGSGHNNGNSDIRHNLNMYNSGWPFGRSALSCPYNNIACLPPQIIAPMPKVARPFSVDQFQFSRVLLTFLFVARKSSRINTRVLGTSLLLLAAATWRCHRPLIRACPAAIYRYCFHRCGFYGNVFILA